jgi:hypothetical protein
MEGQRKRLGAFLSAVCEGFDVAAGFFPTAMEAGTDVVSAIGIETRLESLEETLSEDILNREKRARFFFFEREMVF